MKKMALVLLTAVMGSQANAAKLETCINKIANECGGISILGVALDVQGDAFCKIVQSGAREQGGKFAERVVVADANSISSVVTSNQEGTQCEKSVAQISGRITDSVVIDGRMYFSHSSGAVMVIGRNNNILEMLSSKGKSYSSAVGVKAGENGSLVIIREGNQETELDSEQLNERVNKKSKVRCLTRSGC